MKIAILQIKVGYNKSENLKHAHDMIIEASKSGAELIILPELFQSPYHKDYFDAFAEEKGGPTECMLSNAARDTQTVIVGGSFVERIGSRLFNTSLVFNERGECMAKHQKVHLFDIDVPGKLTFKESLYLSAGNQITTVETELGVLGVAICYDLRFPEMFRAMANRGAQIVVVPAAFNMVTGPMHWALLAQARAVDYQTFVVMCSPARDLEAPYVAYGNSLAVAPNGDIIGQLAGDEGILMVDVNLDDIASNRLQMPYANHIRPDLYGTLHAQKG